MSDFDGLQARVAATAERLALAQGERRQRNRSLVETLARLEEKFAAQQQEIAFYRERVRPLEVANEQLRALMARLLDMVDAGLAPGEDGEDPVHTAVAKAAQMLDCDLIPVSAAMTASSDVEEGGDAPGVDEMTMHYEDVGSDVLALEAANDTELSDLPEIVRTAQAAAQADFLEDDIAEEIARCAAAATAEVNGTDELAGEAMAQPSASDIHALLQRVEAAAARMASAAEAGTAAEPVPGQGASRRVAGAA